MQLVMKVVAPLVPRNYIVMEVRENLIKTCRKATVAYFSLPCYKKVARVIMGEPNDKFKQIVHKDMLKKKEVKAKADWQKHQMQKEQARKQAAAKAKQAAIKAEREKRLAEFKAIAVAKRQR